VVPNRAILGIGDNCRDLAINFDALRQLQRSGLAWHDALASFADRAGPIIASAVVVGLITGVGAVLFRALIGLVHNIAFLGSFAINYDASVFTPPSPWGRLSSWFLSLAASSSPSSSPILHQRRGHGVPEVMDAIYYKEGVIRPVVALIKSLASALSIGTALPSAAKAQSSRSAPRLALCSASLSHGAVATHHAGGGWRRGRHCRDIQHPDRRRDVRHRVVLPELSARTFLPVALATGTATFIGRLFFGIHPAFAIPTSLLTSEQPATLPALLLFALLGCFVGSRRLRFIRGLSLAEDLLNTSKIHIFAMPSAC